MIWRVMMGAVAIAFVASARVEAQDSTSAVSAQVTAAVERARSLSAAGEGGKVRALLDSLVGALPRGSNDAAEALYWRATLADDGAQAERAWKQLVIDAPLSSRAADALLQLAEIDRTRGDLDLARQRLERVLNDHSDSPQRFPALLALARNFFVARNAPRACGVLDALRHDAPLSAVELRLQADEMQQQCRGVQTIAMGAPRDSMELRSGGSVSANSGAAGSTATAPGNPANGSSSTKPTTTSNTTTNPAASSSSTKPTTPPATAVPESTSTKPSNTKSDTPSATAAKGTWTVQVAAYDTRAQADALVKRLAKRNLRARVDGARKPFRVHIGRYDTRAAASQALAQLKKNGQKSAFVTQVQKP